MASTSASRGSGSTTAAPSLAASAAWAGQRATLSTSTSGWRERRMAVVVVPRAPAPYTTARPPGGGGLRVTAWSDTEKGSASTATSSGTWSGTGTSMESWAGSRGAKPPVASLALPVWMPGESRPSRKLQHRLRSPAAQAGQGGSMPRGAQDSQGLRTTRWPGSRPRARGPTSATVPTTSCPSTWGKEMKAVMQLSPASPSSAPMKTCLASEPQMPVMRVSTTTQSGPNSPGSSTSLRAMGVRARACCMGFGAASSAAAPAPTASGATPNTSALTAVWPEPRPPPSGPTRR